MRRGARPLAVLALAVAGGAAVAGPPLTDGPKGMTCHYYLAAAQLRWHQPGGDWVDARGEAGGDRPFARSAVGRADGPQPVEVDIAALARTWGAGSSAPSGAVLLRPLASPRAATVQLASREHPDVQARPALHIAWDDGVRARLEPSADTYTACPTHRSVGREPRLGLGGTQAALLVFPFEARPGHKLVEARLTLTSLRRTEGLAIVVFAPTTPASTAAPLRAGLAQAHPGDAGMATHPDVVFAETFERPDWADAWLDGDVATSPRTVDADRDGRFEPLDGKALRVVVEAGQRQGLNMHLRLARRPGGEPEEAYFRYYLRLGDDWDPVASGGKLPGLSGTYDRAGWGGRRADGVNGWSARGAFFQQVPDDPELAAVRGIGSYVYHADGKDDYGDSFGWNLGPTGALEKNRWYCIEQYVKLNQPGVADGVLRAWVDGRLAFEKTDLRYRQVPELRIESVWMNVYHGGTAKAPQRLTLYIDNVVVARQYIGPLARRR